VICPKVSRGGKGIRKDFLPMGHISRDLAKMFLFLCVC